MRVLQRKSSKGEEIRGVEESCMVESKEKLGKEIRVKEELGREGVVVGPGEEESGPRGEGEGNGLGGRGQGGGRGEGGKKRKAQCAVECVEVGLVSGLRVAICERTNWGHKSCGWTVQRRVQTI